MNPRLEEGVLYPATGASGAGYSNLAGWMCGVGAGFVDERPAVK